MPSQKTNPPPETPLTGSRTANAVRCFGAGMFGASWIGTGGAIIVCLFIYSLFAVLITPQYFVARPQRFMADRQDGYPSIKAAAMRIAAVGPDDAERIVVIGDSEIREAITSADDLRQKISARTSNPVEVTLLCAGGLTAMDAVDLCGLLRGHMHGRILLEISPFWISKGIDQDVFDQVQNRLGYDTPDLADEYRAAGLSPPVWEGNFFLRNCRFMLAHNRAFLRLLRPLPEPPAHSPHRQGMLDDAAFLHESERCHKITHEMSHRAPVMAAVYARLIARLHTAGIEVTLLEAPFNPRLIGDSPHAGVQNAILNYYRRDRRLLAVSNHVPVWDVNAQARLDGRDFHDAYHLFRPAARERFTNALADQIAGGFGAKGPA